MASPATSARQAAGKQEKPETAEEYNVRSDFYYFLVRLPFLLVFSVFSHHVPLSLILRILA